MKPVSKFSRRYSFCILLFEGVRTVLLIGMKKENYLWKSIKNLLCQSDLKIWFGETKNLFCPKFERIIFRFEGILPGLNSCVSCKTNASWDIFINLKRKFSYVRINWHIGAYLIFILKNSRFFHQSPLWQCIPSLSFNHLNTILDRKRNIKKSKIIIRIKCRSSSNISNSSIY